MVTDILAGLPNLDLESLARVIREEFLLFRENFHWLDHQQDRRARISVNPITQFASRGCGQNPGLKII